MEPTTVVNVVIVSGFSCILYIYILGVESIQSTTVVLAKTLESPLDCKKIQPVHPKGNQS